MAMRYALFWEVTPYGSLKTDISEEHITSIIRMTRSIASHYASVVSYC
jgi:hypothetical protein